MGQAERASLRKWHLKEGGEVASHPIFIQEHSGRENSKCQSPSGCCVANRPGMGQETQKLVNPGER